MAIRHMWDISASIAWQDSELENTEDNQHLRWRLSPKNEPALERVVNDTVAVAWEGVYRLKKLVRQ